MEKDIQAILAALPSVEDVARMPRNQIIEAYAELLSLVQFLIESQMKMQEQIYTLQRRLNTNSSNSGIPSSRNPIGYEESQTARTPQKQRTKRMAKMMAKGQQAHPKIPKRQKIQQRATSE